MLKKLKQQRAEIAQKMRDLYKTLETEDRGLTADEKTNWEEWRAAIAGLDERIKTAEEAEELRIERDLEEAANELGGDNIQLNANARSGDNDSESEYGAAFGALMRSIEPGMSGLAESQRELLRGNFAESSAPQLRAMAAGSGAAGGFAVPEGFGNRVVETMLQFGGIMGKATVLNTSSGEDIPFPRNDDTGNVGILIGENVQATDLDATLGQVILNSYPFSSRVIRVSYKLLGAEFGGLEDLIARILGRRIGRAAAAYFATGTGSSQPQGISVGASAGHTFAAAAALQYDDLTGLKYSLDAAYHNGAEFVMNQNTLQLIEELEDNDGRPLWLPGLADRAPATILGHGYQVDNSMPDATTGLRSMVFGQLSEYYVRQNGPVRLMRLVERYADFYQVGFLGYQELDGKVMDSSAIKAGTQA